MSVLFSPGEQGCGLPPVRRGVQHPSPPGVSCLSQTLEEMANEIEQVLQNEMDREIPSARIGELVMERLKKVDEVAYVRFASVYRQFKDISTFMEELNKLLAEK